MARETQSPRKGVRRAEARVTPGEHANSALMEERFNALFSAPCRSADEKVSPYHLYSSRGLRREVLGSVGLG